MQPFVVKLVGLAKGSSQIAWTVGREFFEEFGNTDILDADLTVRASLSNHGLTIDVSCDIDGTVTVACDRCLEDLVIPVETSFEETYTPESDELDMGQEVYDYVCISIPIQRVHPDGECNSETTKYLSK
ncbi:MAG TPA: hypothetical protein DHU72_02040 [Rikenellaceae bacterium]|mgnify:CR=1 FL=1|nr:hypothetical protein [Rikenellaceae bacterium]